MRNAEGKMRNGMCGMFLRNGGQYVECGKLPSRRSDAFPHGLQGAGVVVGVYRSSDVCLW